MKRFWTTATPHLQDGQYQVWLDQRPVKLPSGAPLSVPHLRLATEIAREWAAAAPIFSPHDLPLTQLVCTAQERVAPQRADIIQQLVAYGLNDLLCYRAGEPPALSAHQSAAWDPWLGWMETTYETRLLTTTGLMPITQPPQTAATLQALLAGRSDDQIAALGVLIPALGSFVLGLAVADAKLEPAPACELAMLDELWQAKQWGDDPHATASRQTVQRDVAQAATFLGLLTP